MLENKLQFGENSLYKLLVDHSAEAIVLMQEETILDCNEAVLRMLGCKKEDIAGKGTLDFFVDSSLGIDKEKESLKDIISDAIKGVAGHFEFSYSKQDGTNSMYQATLDSFTDSNIKYILAFLERISKPNLYEETIEDISSNRNNHTNFKSDKFSDIDASAIRTSELKFRALFENSVDAIYILDLEGRVLEINKEACQRLEYSKEEMIGSDIREIDNEKDPILIGKRFEGVFANGSNYFQSLHITKSGKLIPVEIIASLIDYDGNRAIMGVARDISERLKSEETIRKKEAKLKAIFQNNSQMSAILDTCGKIVNVNSAAVAMAGVPEDELKGKYYWDGPWWSHSEKQKVRAKDAFIKAISPEFVRFETTHISADGIIIDIDFSLAPILDQFGSIINLVFESHDITELKKAHLDLKEEIEKKKLLLDSTAEGIFGVDLNGICAFCNKSAVELLGYDSPDSLIGKNLHCMIHYTGSGDEQCERKECIITSPSKTGQKVHLDSEIFCKSNGEKFPIEFWSHPIIKNGLIDGAVVSFLDISERKTSVMNLKASEERFAQITETAGEWIWESDKDGLYTYSSQLVEKIIGFYPEEIVGKKHFYELFTPESWESIKEIVTNVLFQKIPFKDRVNEFLHKDGSIVIIESSGLPIFDNTGNITGYRGVSRNFTDRIKTENELKKSEALFKGLVDNAFDAISMTTGFKYHYANSRFCELTGYSLDEILDDNFDMKMLLTEESKLVVDELVRARRNGETIPNQFELVLQHKSGLTIETEFSVVIIKDGNDVYHLSMIRDITQRKEIERKLLEAKQKAELLSQAKSQFLSTISHELRTPLNGIIGFSEILEEEMADPEMKEIAYMVRQSGKRLHKTLNQIIDFASVEASYKELNITEINLSEEIDSLVYIYKSVAEKKNLYIDCVIVDNSIMAKIDEVMFRTILSNLLDNAVKFTNSGGIIVRFEKIMIDKSYWGLISIRDTGIGIPIVLQDIIFEEFRQASEGHSRNFEGIGLGLSISKRYVELMKGKIDVQSTPNFGTTFNIYLPLLPEINEEAIDNEDSEKRGLRDSAEIAEASIPRILLVEDDIMNQNLMYLTLNKYCHLDISETGEKAIDMCQSNSYDLILMDINLGFGMSGIEAVEIIRKNNGYKDIPIVAVTSYAKPSDKKEFLSKGCSHYISKPFNIGELISLVTSLIGKN